MHITEYRKLVRDHTEPCTTCHAAPGHPCRAWNGQTQTQMTPVHEERSRAFWEAEAAKAARAGQMQDVR